MTNSFSQWAAQLQGDNLTAATLAAEALGKSGDPRARAALESRFTPYRFMRSNTDEQNRFYFTLALVLAEMGSFHGLRMVADEDAPFVRGRVSDMFERVGNHRVIGAAIPMLAGENIGERWWAAEILRTLKATSASAALVDAQAKETHFDVRINMIGALGEAGNADAIPVLEAIRDETKSLEMRRVTTYVLEKLKSVDS